MIIYYNKNGIIKDIVYAYEACRKIPPVGCLVYDVIESSLNQALCKDIFTSRGKLDINGLQKYYIDADGDLAVVDGWEPAPEYV